MSRLIVLLAVALTACTTPTERSATSVAPAVVDHAELRGYSAALNEADQTGRTIRRAEQVDPAKVEAILLATKHHDVLYWDAPFEESVLVLYTRHEIEAHNLTLVGLPLIRIQQAEINIVGPGETTRLDGYIHNPDREAAL